MFQGDHHSLTRVMRAAGTTARRFAHPRVGSEHLVLALTTVDTPVADALAAHGITEGVLTPVVREVGDHGAGAAADREMLAPLGVDVAGLLPVSALDRPLGREPLFPLAAARARERAARAAPPIGLDAQAAYAASLRLALARRERAHRPEHLALVLAGVDPGAAWTITQVGISPAALHDALAGAFPPPRRNPLLRLERHLGSHRRRLDLLRRYHRTTGRVPHTLIL
ncbi:Clp protease N-terminal domain-containing protein [Actinokineospora auranticolor]|uniref:ClpA/ClpB-like protein n=1 Tax=Actinokineospora auranticolor TaxID=155976 RepID=A0A2S6GC65_9PSEU|nr:Clp protease N-terminal domain-containing protein [Actinokineospora auranticolor]PPK62044.1 ClpA/ClpB-like protein [Actinokineospora auranticolor]